MTHPFRLLTIAAAAATLTACANAPDPSPRVEVREVATPVAVTCAPPLGAAPVYPDTDVALMAAPAVLVLRAVGRQDKAMVAPVAVYILAIATMAAAAMAGGGVMTSFAWLPIIGGLSFVASDLLLAINRFVRPLPREALLVHVTYHAAIAGLSLGLLVIAS